MILFDVVISGRSVAQSIMPILKSIQTFDGSDNEADSANVVLMDQGEGIPFPKAREPVQISLGAAYQGVGKVFDGFVDDPRSKGDRSTGSEIHVSCKSVDLESKSKEPQEKTWDDASLDTIIRDAFEGTDIDVYVDPVFAGITRQFEAMDGRDPLSFAADMAMEAGATFKAMGPKGVFASRNSGLAIGGLPLVNIEAAYGRNLLTWDLAPTIPKALWSASKTRWFDFDASQWREVEEALNGKVPLLSTAQRATEAFAGEFAKGAKAENEREQQAGHVTIRGDWKAQVGAKCIVSGINPSVSRAYIIASVTHTATKADGWVTKLELKQLS